MIDVAYNVLPVCHVIQSVKFISYFMSCTLNHDSIKLFFFSYHFIPKLMHGEIENYLTITIVKINIHLSTVYLQIIQ